MQSRNLVILAGPVGFLVALLVIVRRPIPEAHLRIFGYGLRIGQAAVQPITVRRIHHALVNQLFQIVLVRIGIEVWVTLVNTEIVGMGVLLILGVEIVEKAVHRKRTSRLPSRTR